MSAASIRTMHRNLRTFFANMARWRTDKVNADLAPDIQGICRFLYSYRDDHPLPFVLDEWRNNKVPLTASQIIQLVCAYRNLVT